MTTQSILNQIGREVAAAASFGQGMTLEFIHHAPGKGHVDALRLCSVRDSGTAGTRGGRAESLLELMDQIFQKWHDFLSISYQYWHDDVLWWGVGRFAPLRRKLAPLSKVQCVRCH